MQLFDSLINVIKKIYHREITTPTKFLFFLYNILLVFSYTPHLQGRSPKEPPQYIIPIVIDQGAYHYWTRFGRYFQHGFKRFTDKGVVFTNAHHPHAAPVTATGHTTLSTGSLPAKHGIILNTWYNKEGALTASVDDDRDVAEVLPAHGSCSCHASSKTIMVPAVSDLAMQASSQDYSYHAFGISYKDRAAIGMTGHKGKAIWFDEHQQAFTSNHEYFDELPAWIHDFNKTLSQKIELARIWKLFFQPSHEVYSNYAKEIYHLSTVPKTIAGSILDCTGEWKKITNKKNFMLTPESNQILLDLALTAIDAISKKGSPQDRALIWISLSSLDKIGHIYGPHSTETIDTILHLDKIIGDFMSTIEARYGKNKTMFILTADHGVSPIPENMVQENYRPARRIIMHKVVTQLNEAIAKKFGINKLFFGFKTNQFFWNEKKLAETSNNTRAQITKFTKKFLYGLDGIKKVWTFDELNSTHPLPNSIKAMFKNQLYKGRSGAFFLLGRPFVMLTNYDKGSCHRTPYNHDTQVPMMVLYGDKLTPRTIKNRVWTTQLAPLIAKTWGLKPHKDMIHKPLPKVI